MNESLWAISAKIIVPLEALAGIALNMILIVVLLRTDIGKAGRVYWITIMITAVLGAYFSLLLLLIQFVYILVDGIIVDVLYGPILHYLPEKMNDILVTAFFAQGHTWLLLPGPSVVQWMHLTKPDTSTMRRIIMAYTVPVIFHVNAWYWMSFTKPDDELKAFMFRSISALHGTDPGSYHVYGARFFDDERTDLFALILYNVLPSFVICYGIFTLCAVQIQIRLRSYGNAVSRKTALMQRRFFLSQIVQVLLPLFLSAVPIAIVLIAVLVGLSLANVSILLSYSMWLMPSATASLFLIFVTKSSSKQIVQTPTVSTSKVEQMNSEYARKISMILRKTSFNQADRMV